MAPAIKLCCKPFNGVCRDLSSSPMVQVVAISGQSVFLLVSSSVRTTSNVGALLIRGLVRNGFLGSASRFSQSRNVARIEVWSKGVCPGGVRNTVPGCRYDETRIVGTRTPKRLKSNVPSRDLGHGLGAAAPVGGGTWS